MNIRHYCIALLDCKLSINEARSPGLWLRNLRPIFESLRAMHYTMWYFLPCCHTFIVQFDRTNLCRSGLKALVWDLAMYVKVDRCQIAPL